MAPNYSDTCMSARLGNDPGNKFDLGSRQNVDPPFWTPFLDPLLDPFLDPSFFEQSSSLAARKVLRILAIYSFVSLYSTIIEILFVSWKHFIRLPQPSIRLSGSKQSSRKKSSRAPLNERQRNLVLKLIAVSLLVSSRTI